jgi:nicotinate-nucleotide adenylyltransferase
MIDVGIMGGTFNPPRTRQQLLAQCAIDQFHLKKVIFVPNGNPPHKKDDVLDKELRFEMCAALAKGNRKFEASRIEVDRPGITWTIDTLKEFKQQFGPCVRLNFIMGEDNIEALRKYARRDEFLTLCRLLVAARGCADEAMVKNWRELLPGADLEAIDCPADASSSTLVRDWLRAGKSVRYLVPPAVHKILVEKRLYLPEAVVSSGSTKGQRKRRKRDCGTKAA